MSNNKYIIVIPARFDSKRLPGKVLELIGNNTMIYRTMENSVNIPNIEKTFLCTDNKSIANEAKGLPVQVILKSGNFSSGTDRIYHSISEILQNLNFKDDYNINNLYIINIQADQPFINKNIINDFIENINLMDRPELVTAYFKKKYDPSKDCNDLVKLINSKKSKKVLYFSRSLIPYINKININQPENSEGISLKCHIGIYAYRFDILQAWENLARSDL